MKKLLMALVALISVSAVHTASSYNEDIGHPFTHPVKKIWSESSTPTGKTSAYTVDDQEFEKELALYGDMEDQEHIKAMLHMLRGRQLPKKVDERPATAPAAPRVSQQELKTEALFKGTPTQNAEEYRERLTLEKAASEGGTPKFITSAGTPKFIRKIIKPLQLSAEEERLVKQRLKDINALYVAMEYADILQENDPNPKTITEKIAETLDPSEEARTVINKMKKRVKAKQAALLALDNKEITAHHEQCVEDFPQWETDFEFLIHYVMAFFKPATRNNKTAQKALQRASSAPIGVELSIDTWRPKSVPRGGTPASSVYGGSRPSSAGSTRSTKSVDKWFD